MSTFLEAVMALREAGLCVLANVRERGISREWAIDYGTIEEVREAVHNPELSDDALRALDEDRARELVRVEYDGRRDERGRILDAAEIMRDHPKYAQFVNHIYQGRHRQSDLTPIIEPGPVCSERGDTVCKRREDALK